MFNFLDTLNYPFKVSLFYIVFYLSQFHNAKSNKSPM